MHRTGTGDPVGGQTIQYADSGVAAARFEPIHAMFQNAVKHARDQPALVLEPVNADDSDGGAVVVTWKQYYDQSLAAGRSLMAQNLAASDSIALIGEKCLNFLYAYFGAMMVGCLPVCLQNPLVTDHKRVLADLQPSVVFLDSPKGLKSVLGLRNTMPFMKNIVICRGLIPPVVKTAHRDFVLSWDEFIEKAGWVTADMVIERQAQVQVENCATVVFTSGSTQQARGVMLSHDTLQFTASSFIDTQEWASERGMTMRGVSHGHLSSIYTQLYDLVLPLVFTGLNIGNFCVHVPSVDVNYNLPALFRLVKATRPTMVFGTPDFWELVAIVLKGQSALGKLNSPTAGVISPRASGATSPRGSVSVPNELAVMGLDRCKLALWGDRSWKSSTLNYFREIGFDLLECYGLTECCGLAICSSKAKNAVSSCGARLKGTELRVSRKADRDDVGTGELLLRGRHVMMGYYRFPSLTKDAIDSAGWLRTEDIGQLDEGGMLYFLSKCSESVQNSSGEYVSLCRIEDGIRAVCPYVGTVVAFGENRDFNICIVYLKTRRDPQSGVSTEDLDAEAAAVNPDVRTTSGARSDKTWQQVVARAIQQYNSSPHCLAPTHKVSRFAFMQSEPTVDGGELSIGSKLRRGAIVEKYHLVLDRLYSAGSKSGGEKPTTPRMARSNTII
jgi:long-subunit acyl-CoA synthetase (AMP-forming)